MLVDVTSVEVGISVDVMGLIQLENKAMKFWVRGGMWLKFQGNIRLAHYVKYVMCGCAHDSVIQV